MTETAVGVSVDVKFSIALPRDAISIPLARRVIGDTLRNLGVAEDCVSDILIAVSEACTNAFRHGGPAHQYEVVGSVGRVSCVLKVVDRGHGFRDGDVEPAGVDAESGRGLQLMRALVDDVSIDTGPDTGTVVYLHKNLDWRPGAPLRSTRRHAACETVAPAR